MPPSTTDLEVLGEDEMHAIALLDQATALLDEVRDAPSAKKLADYAAGAEIYARKMRLGADAISYAAGIRVDALRLLGFYLREMPRAKQGRPKKGSGEEPLPTLATLQIDKKTSSTAQRFSVMKPPEFEAKKAEIIKVAVGIKAPGKRDGCDPDEYYTPEDPYILLVREVLGVIDLDPASCARANKVVGAAEYFDKEADGLPKPWHGRVFMNPPFSLGKEFASKLISEYQADRVMSAIVLQNAQTSSGWFQGLAARGPICLLDHRISFLDETGERVDGNRQGQAFFFLGPEHEWSVFARAFRKLGVVGKLDAAGPPG